MISARHVNAPSKSLSKNSISVIISSGAAINGVRERASLIVGNQVNVIKHQDIR
jgi:hypothetical protein